MLNFLYIIFIFPVEQIIELSYIFVFKIFKNPGLSVLGVSIAVSAFTLPLYFIAEKYQILERNIQKTMKSKINIIKSCHTGDERFMLLSTYYRQNNYHPLYSLRSSISLIIQIPFFIAAYHYLVNLELIKRIPFGPFADLSKPDALLSFNNFSINILPIAMTLISCFSSLLYARELPAKDNIQLYGMASIFLILLYNSPSGMVLYWTGNNIFSLIKNIIQKIKNPKLAAYLIMSFFCLILFIYILFFHNGALIRRILVSFILILIPVQPFINKYIKRIIKNISFIDRLFDNIKSFPLYLFSLFILFILSGIVIPSSLIDSSVQEFSFINDYTTPFPFILNTAIQSFGIFIIWPVCLYFLFSKKTKQIISIAISSIACISLANVFLFPGKYGYLTLLLTFSENVKSAVPDYFVNILTALFIIILIIFLLYRFKNIFYSFLIVCVTTLIIFGTWNIVNIYSKFNIYKIQRISNKVDINKPIYQFSRNGQNVILVMLDRALGGFVPYIFEEKPELLDSYDGFTWYKNTTSYSLYTNMGAPSLYGGYEYTPLNINKRNDISLVEKHNESLLLLPLIFNNNGFTVTITDPTYANYSWTPDLSIFKKYPELNVFNVQKIFTSNWIKNNTDFINYDFAYNINNNLIRFSIFKFSFLFIRNFIYDRGKWLTLKDEYDEYIDNAISPAILYNYASLDLLPNISIINDYVTSTFSMLSNDLTHEPYVYFQAPDYKLKTNVTNIGAGPFAADKNYHVNITSITLLGKWLNYLKENNIYDNTRIIIVSDHGRDLKTNLQDNIILPNGWSVEAFNCLLLVKDFNAKGRLAVNNDFMTNADVPLIALKDIVENPVNPFTGNILTSNKANGATVTTSELHQFGSHPNNNFDIKPNEWMHVHTNIFDPANWSFVK